MCLLIGISQPAGSLLFLNAFRVCRERKRNHSLISKLLLHLWKVDASLVSSCRCSCFKTEHFNSVCDQGVRQMGSCLQSVWSRRVAYVPVDTSCTQIGSCTQYNCFRVIYGPWEGLNTLNLAVLDYQLRNLCLTDGQMLCILHGLSHLTTVFLLIRLGP